MKCPWRGCEVVHNSLKEAVDFHKERGEFESPNTCPLDYHFDPVLKDGERVSSKKPSLDDYDRSKS